MSSLDEELTRAGGSAVLRRHGQIERQWGASGPNQHFSVASVSKQYVAVALLVLVRSGGVGLDAPLSTVVPDGPSWWSTVSVRHLLTHTGGFGHWDRVGDMSHFAALDQDEQRDRIRSLEPLHAPGAAWHYSGIGYVLLGEVIASLTGNTYSDYLHARVLDPLGLQDTISGPRPQSPARSPGELSLLTIPGTGDLWSTAEDVTAFAARIREAALFGPDRNRDRLRPLVALGEASYDVGYVAADAYGFGLFIGSLNGQPAAFHPGDNPGWQSFAASFRDTATDLSILVRDDDVDMRALVRAFITDVTS